MQRLDLAILHTLIYGDIFKFPMTDEEIHHFLIFDQPTPLKIVQSRLASSPELLPFIISDGTYYALASHPEYLDLRHEREDMMQSLSPRMVRYGRLLAYLPFVELIGITGALSMRNPSSANDDLDYIVITRPGRVWLARATIIILVRLMRLWNIEICPNYVLASDQLIQKRKDLYIAHEVAQMIPLSNEALYQEMREKNRWTNDYLPNARRPLNHIEVAPFNRAGKLLKSIAETVLSSPIGNWLERWEYRRKSRRFEEQAQSPNASAQIDTSHVKGHFNDYGTYVLAQYQERIQEFELAEEDSLEAVGD